MKKRLNLNETIQTCLLVSLGLFFLARLVHASQWRMFHDLPIVHYVAFLIDRYDMVPYRDIIEFSMPGTLLFHITIGRLLGYGDIAINAVNIAVLLLLLTITWFLMRPIGQRVAWASALLFGLIYLSYGPVMTLERDYLGILPVAGSLLLSNRKTKRLPLMAFLIGGLFALSSSIKPQLAMGLPIVVLHFLSMQNAENQAEGTRYKRPVRKTVFYVILGFALFFSLFFVWLGIKGALTSFYELYSGKLPTYLKKMGGVRDPLQVSRLRYITVNYLIGIRVYWVPIIIGLYVALFQSDASSRHRRIFRTLGILALVYSIYPIIGGKFWGYHWMPFIFFAVLCSALVLIPIEKTQMKPSGHLFLTGLFIAFLIIAQIPFPGLSDEAGWSHYYKTRTARADRIASVLKRAQLRPEDTVQLLGRITSSGLYAMLMAEARAATRFLTDIPLQSPKLGPEMQNEFYAELEGQPPRFILNMRKPSVTPGTNYQDEHPRLKHFLRDNYVMAARGYGFDVLELKKR